MRLEDLDLSIADRLFYRLQHEDGDLGAEYWHQIAELLRRSAEYRGRAERAEARLRELDEDIPPSRSSG
jgi:hypothetical protein